MPHAHETKVYTFERTAGRCHICRETLIFDRYGMIHVRGAWEIDHSNPRARGGTDYLRNLLPACPPCNRSKRAGSTRSARRAWGHTRAPLSREKQEDRRTNNTLIGGAAGALLGITIAGSIGALVWGIAGALLGHDEDVD